MFQATPFSQNYTDPARSSTTLGRWHRGYHGFEPNLTNKLGVSCNLSCSPSPAVRFRTGDPVTRCKYIPVSSASPSLARKVTVPPVPENEVYVCGHIGRFKQVSSHRIAPTPPMEPSLALLPISSKGRTGPCAWMHLHHDFMPLAQRLALLSAKNSQIT
ncbi:hypothetical protein C8J23_103159 [Shewanella chilikensis]|uniref:Uncharacterized protein n=1 Tax=Shewanella chilikensis TaxID=558541 RepID=A0ABX5PSB3_9GAMM|nr:hypothetical protein C8J23_103159 [Shewanella chilikensis]